MKDFAELDEFTQGYIEAMFFTEQDDAGDVRLGDAGIYEISDELAKRINEDCALFQKKAKSLITEENCLNGSAKSYAGHDFWMTRNGHGCGFWETFDWVEAAGIELTKLSKEFGVIHVYVGDDGKIYAE